MAVGLAERGALLDELVEVGGYSRKHAITLLNQSVARHGEFSLTREARAGLASISCSILARRLAELPVRRPQRRRRPLRFMG